MNLSLRQLRAFAAIAEQGSFTSAATQLHLTQSALSVLIRELEREMGVRLFDRHTRRVQLSIAGEELRPHVERVLSELNRAAASMRNLRDKKRGVLRIAAPQLMASTLLPQAMAAYSESYPDVEVLLTDTVPEHMFNQVMTGSVELAIAGHNWTELRRSLLQRDEHRLVCRADHPLVDREFIFWDELQGNSFIAPAPGFMTQLKAGLGVTESGHLFDSTREVSYVSTALSMVAAGMGITVCPWYSAPLIAGYGLRIGPVIRPVFVREVYIYSSPFKSLSPAALSFIGFLEHSVNASARQSSFAVSGH